MATAACKIKDKKEMDNPNIVKVTMDRNNFALYFSRSKIPYHRENHGISVVYKHLGLYSFRKEFLDRFPNLPQGELEKAESLEQLRVLENGYKLKVVKTTYDGVGVDTKEDLDKVVQRISLLRKSENQ
jgi:3-deoxy-manno-octulosonate cytidylyltransferase (CMP-KDO synthetase)